MTDDFFAGLLDPNAAQHYVAQGSEAWDRIRVGRFTSSEFHKLMTPGRRLMTEEEKALRPKKGPGSSVQYTEDYAIMSDTAKTYIKSKVAEILTGRPRPQAYAYPLVYGKEQEPFAVAHFEAMTGFECEEFGFCPYTDHAGGSPDRLIGETDGLEVKCPYTSDKQIDYLMLTDMFDLKREFPEYYWQCVTLLLFTGRKRWHFCTYDDRFIEEKHKMTHITIDSNSPHIQSEFELIGHVIEAATKEKYEQLKLVS